MEAGFVAQVPDLLTETGRQWDRRGEKATTEYGSGCPGVARSMRSEVG
jgi:hypothetical protein